MALESPGFSRGEYVKVSINIVFFGLAGFSPDAMP